MPDHVDFQLPNELTRVKLLLEAIDNSSAELQAAIAMIRQDNGPEGKMNNFESAVAHLIPADPVAKRHTEGPKRPHASVASSEAQHGSPNKRHKSGVGTTGMELRFHNGAEYAKLNSLQKSELYEWHKTPEGTKTTRPSNGRPIHGNNQDKKIAAAVAKFHKKRETTKQSKLQVVDEMKVYIMSLITQAKPPTANLTAPATSVVAVQAQQNPI